MMYGIDIDGVADRVAAEHGPAWDAFVAELTAARSKADSWREVDLLGYLRRADALIRAHADDLVAAARAAVDASRLNRRARRIFLRHTAPLMRAELIARRWDYLGGWTPAKAAAVIAAGETKAAAIDDEFGGLLAEALED